jgi:hypothetical protein
MSERISIPAKAWKLIDAILLDLPYRTTAPVVQALNDGGGVQEAPQETATRAQPCEDED